MVVRSASVKQANPVGNVTVAPDGVNANTITVMFDNLNENVVAEKSTAQEIADFILSLLKDIFGIFGDVINQVINPVAWLASLNAAFSGNVPPSLTDIVNKSADIATQIQKFLAQSHSKTVRFTVPVIELNPLDAKCNSGYSVDVTANGTTTKGTGPMESATLRQAISWLAGQPLQSQGGIDGNIGDNLPFTCLAELSGQTGAQAHADPAYEITMSVSTDGDPTAKPSRHSEVKLTKVTFVLNSIQGC